MKMKSWDCTIRELYRAEFSAFATMVNFSTNIYTMASIPRMEAATDS